MVLRRKSNLISLSKVDHMVENHLVENMILSQKLPDFIAIEVRLSIKWSNLTFDEVITLMDDLDTSLNIFDQLCGFRRSDIRRSNLSPRGFGANFIWIIATEFQSFKKLLEEQKEPGNNDL
jgi:hypothetical protein